MVGERPCPVDACIDPVKPGQLMCYSHWKALPVKIQREVNATWRRYRYEPEAYLEARAAALAYHNGGNAPAAQGTLL